MLSRLRQMRWRWRLKAEKDELGKDRDALYAMVDGHTVADLRSAVCGTTGFGQNTGVMRNDDEREDFVDAFLWIFSTQIRRRRFGIQSG